VGGGGALVAQLGEALFAKWAGQIGAKRVHLDSKPLRQHFTSKGSKFLEGTLHSAMPRKIQF
jgi:hypothetical protein